MPSIPNFTANWDGGAVLESSGLMSINGVSLENGSEWSGFRWMGHAIRGTVAVSSQAAFLAALDAASTGLPLTRYRCVDAVSEEVTTGSYVIRTEALQPGGHFDHPDYPACRHIIVADDIEWTFSGTTATGQISTDPALSRWGFIEYASLSEGSIAVACSNAGTNLASDYGPWAGDNEERCEITTTSAVPAGNTVIAVVGATKVHGATGQVYDERGNTWTKDADYENTQSSGDNNVQIWRCNVTSDLQAGDYIRFAWNLGSSLLSNTETGGRCIGAYAYSGTLSVSSVGTGAGDGQFNQPISINTPAGDVVVAGLAAWSETAFAADGDWSAMIPHTSVTGSGDLSSCVFAQQLTDAGASTWDLGAHGDWAAIAVGYTRS